MLHSILVILLTVGSSYAILTITKIHWRSIEAFILMTYAFCMSVLLSLALVAVLDAAWFLLFHTSFLDHIRDGDLIQHLRAGWEK